MPIRRPEITHTTLSETYGQMIIETSQLPNTRITSYNVCYTKLLRTNTQAMRANNGFTSARIVNPPTENGGAITYTDYEFWGAIPSGGNTNLTLEDYLYFGKPKTIRTYAQDGTLLV